MIDSPGNLGTRSHQAGVSLIEVLVSIFVLTFGILGIAAMQAGALRNTQGAMEQSTAVFLTNSILDAMRASMQPDQNPDTTRSGAFVVRQGYATNDKFICKDGDVDATDTLVANDLKRWLKNIQNNLNGSVADDNACGRITCDTNNDPNLCTAEVRWNSSRSLGGAAQQIVETRSRL